MSRSQKNESDRILNDNGITIHTVNGKKGATMSLVGKTPEERTWNYLVKSLGNKFGAAGVMGNLKAESGLIFSRVEILCLRRLKESTGKSWTDDTYTAAVDSGDIGRKEFLNPIPGRQYGYGICQWTSPNRKAGLYDLARSRNVSIADEEMQLDFLMDELSTSWFKDVLSVLKTAKSVREASDIFLLKFEIPANRSESVKSKREFYGQEYYSKYAKTTEVKNMSKDYSKYINSTGTHYISNSGSDEKGKTSGGKSGDQTGNEWCLRSWYNRPWTCILRYEKDPRVGQLMAELACSAALNNNIGYDQNQRNAFWNELQKANYDPAKIDTPCEADCSAGVISLVKAVGHLLNIKELKNITCTYTGNMKPGLKAAGFTVYTDSKYISKPDYLLPGDICLYENHHAATNVTRGSKAAAVNTGKYKESKGSSPSNKVLYEMVCTGRGVNVRTSPTSKEKNLSSYVKPLNTGDKVEYCDQIVGKDGLTWLFVKITTSVHPKGYVHDYVCADYFKKA